MTFPELVLVLLTGALGYFIGKLVEATPSDHEGAICPPVPPWSPYCQDQPIMKIWKGSAETRPPIQKTKEDVIMKTKIKEVLADTVNKQLKETREKNCNRCIFAICENCKINKSMSDLVKEAILFDGDVEIIIKAKGVGVLARSEE